MSKKRSKETDITAMDYNSQANSVQEIQMRQVKSPPKKSYGKFLDAESSLDIDMAKSQVPSE